MKYRERMHKIWKIKFKQNYVKYEKWNIKKNEKSIKIWNKKTIKEYIKYQK